MSGFEVNKIVAALLIIGIVILTGGFIAERVIGHTEMAEHAYQIAALSEESAPADAAADQPAEEQAEPIAALLAAADPGKGQAAAKKCAACHSFEKGGPHKIGPNLWDTVGRPIAAASGYSFSNALQEKSGETWTYEHLDGYLRRPKDWAPGTKMTFAGISGTAERAALIAYMRSLSDSPAPLPE